MNRSAANDTEYFGVVVELLKVDESKPALNFKPVATPNEWARESRSAVINPTEKEAEYRTFFQTLIDELREKHRFTNARVAQPQNWCDFSSGVTGFRYSSSFAANGRIRAEVYIGTRDADANKRAFESLKQRQLEIDTAMGESLVWEDLPNKKACRIACYRYPLAGPHLPRRAHDGAGCQPH